MTQQAQRPVARAPRRRSVWINSTLNIESQAALNQTGRAIDTNRNVTNAEGLTVVRVIFNVWVSADVVTDAVTRFGMGIILVNGDAFTGGTIPDVDATTEDGDWIYLAPAVGLVQAAEGPRGVRLTGDIRSARKYAQGDTLINVFKNLDATNPMDIIGYFRALLLLP